MLALLARISARHPWPIVVLAAVVAIASMLGSIGVQSALSTGGLEDPGSESADVRRELQERFGMSEPGILLVVDAPDPAVMAPLVEGIKADPGVLRVSWPEDDSAMSASLRSADKQRSLIIAELGGDERSQQETWSRVHALADASGLTMLQGGPVPALTVAQTMAIEDLVRAELFSLPIAGLLLLWFFRGPWSAMLPLVTAGVSIPVTIASLGVLARFMEVSVFALNVASFIGLGLSVDYALVLVSRFRDERAHGLDPTAALRVTMATTGRAVFVSGITVAASLSALLVFPLGMLKTIAISGAMVVVATLIAALVLLPAMMFLLADRLGLGEPPSDTGWWHGLGLAVVRRPLLVAVGVIVTLMALGAPVLRLNTIMPDARSFPRDTDIRRIDDLLEDPNGFADADAAPIVAILRTQGDVMHPDRIAAVAAWCERVRELPNVAKVEGPFCTGPLAHREQANALLRAPLLWPNALRQAIKTTTDGDTTIVRVRAAGSWRADPAAELVSALRELEFADVEARVGGPTAAILDARAAMSEGLGTAILVVLGVNLVLLFLAFGSVVVPIKAVAMNAASVGASFGAMVWVFQDGHLAGLLGFEVPGGVDLTVPIVLFSIVFGLSMDYEVFLLARIREEFLRDGDSDRAIAVGLERTGSLITRAAALLAVVVVGFAAGRFLFIQELGVGMVVAILLDATLVRALLVPSTMALLGGWNWWAPAPLKAIHEAVGLGEGH